MLSTETAFDLVPYVADIYDKLDVNSFRKSIQADIKSKKMDPYEAGVALSKYILRNSGKIKEEIFEMVSIIQGKPPEEIRKQDFITTFKAFKEILGDQEAVAFFKSAMQ